MEAVGTPRRTVVLLAADWDQDDLRSALEQAGGGGLERVRYVTSDDDLHELRAAGVRYDHIIAPADWLAFARADAWDAYADARLSDIFASAAPGMVILLGNLGGQQHALAQRLLADVLAEQTPPAMAIPPDSRVDDGESLAAITQWRARLSALPLAPYDQVPPGSAPRLARTITLLDDAMRRWGAHVQAPELAPGEALRLATEGRTAREVHAWEPIDIFLQGHSAVGDARYLTVALGFAGDWLAEHEVNAAATQVGEPVAAKGAAWHPPTTALRYFRLAYLVDVLARHEQVSDASLHFWVASLHTHRVWLERSGAERLLKKHSRAALGLRAARARLLICPPPLAP